MLWNRPPHTCQLGHGPRTYIVDYMYGVYLHVYNTSAIQAVLAGFVFICLVVLFEFDREWQGCMSTMDTYVMGRHKPR